MFHFRPIHQRAARRVYQAVGDLYLASVVRRTNNFGDVTWLGQPIWQNVLDLWTLQEAISELKPSLLLETGTNRGGSALFYAHLFDLLGDGHVVTVDTESLHDIRHPRVEFLIGSSTSDMIIDAMSKAAHSATGPVMVILDSDHSRDHVRRELALYAPLVTPGSLILVQDGIIDASPVFRAARPGPLPAIRSFLEAHNDFYVDDRCDRRFLATHHPHGWLRRR